MKTAPSFIPLIITLPSVTKCLSAHDAIESTRRLNWIPAIDGVPADLAHRVDFVVANVAEQLLGIHPADDAVHAASGAHGCLGTLATTGAGHYV